MILTEVPDFCLANEPCQIFKKLRTEHDLITNLQEQLESKCQTECWSLVDKEEVIFFRPDLTEVIILGKA